MRIRVGPSHRRDRKRPVLPPSVQPVHRRRTLSDDRPRPHRGGHPQLQHRPRRGPQPLFRLGVPCGIHVPPVQEGVHQQPHDPQALRGGRLRGQALPHLQQGVLLGDGDPPQDGQRRGLEGPGPRCHGPRHRRDRRGREGEVLLRGCLRCPSARPNVSRGCSWTGA